MNNENTLINEGIKNWLKNEVNINSASISFLGKTYLQYINEELNKKANEIANELPFMLILNPQVYFNPLTNEYDILVTTILTLESIENKKTILGLLKLKGYL